MNIGGMSFGSAFKWLLLAVCLCIQAHGAERPDWKVVDTRYPTSGIVIAGYDVTDFGADRNGSSDCTKAFQSALDAMADHGGGTVFVPEGKYVLKGRLEIPDSVILRGEWQSPHETGGVVRGTVLMLYADRGTTNAPSAISVGASGGIRDLSIWYPEQTPNDIQPYPFCLEQGGMNNATFRNLTLVNPYLGIKVGPQANELHYVHNVYGTPLKTGIRYDSTTDIGRLQEVYFAADYWARSGLTAAPSAQGKLATWLLNEAVGIHMLRSDWEYVDRVFVNGYSIGFKVSEGERGAANAQFRRLILRNCGIALAVDKTNPYGMVFTECFFQARNQAVLLSPKFDSVVLFSTCIFNAAQALESRGDGVVLMEQCRIQSGDVDLQHGSLSMVKCTLEDSSTVIHIGEDVSGVALAANESFNESQMIDNKAKAAVLQISDRAPDLAKIPQYPFKPERVFKPGRAQLKVLKPSKGEDMTSRIQQAMDQLASSGGGVAFLPGGDYEIRGQLRIPSTVELRGVHDVPHHTKGGGSILHIYSKSNEPTILMDSNSGLRGVSFNYPEQSIESVKEYPFLIQGQGADIYIVDVNAANPYRYLDLMSYRCDRHYVDYLSGSPLKVGVWIGGGSVDGELSNLQFNPHYWSRAPAKNRYFSNQARGGIHSGTGKVLWEFQKENLDAIAIGATENQFLYQNFVYGSLYGIRFTANAAGGPKNCVSHGHGTDGSKVGVFFEHGGERITMINSELVAMSSEDKTAIKVGPEFTAEASLVNTMVWGSPDLLVESEGGKLFLQNLHSTRHGEGIFMKRGSLRAVNLNFLNAQGTQVNVTSGADAQLLGIVGRKSLRDASDSGAAELEMYIQRP